MSEEIKQDEIELAKMLSEEIGEEVEIADKETSNALKMVCAGKSFVENDSSFKAFADMWFLKDPVKVVEFIKINNNAKLPYQATSDAACSDIYSVEDVVIPSGKTKLISTGLKVAHIPTGYKLEVYDRSGMGAKGILLGNGVGQVDSDYRGELKVILFNSNDSDFVVKIGDRIAQVALEKVINVSYKFVDSFEKTDRGEGGFGSTGI